MFSRLVLASTFVTLSGCAVSLDVINQKSGKSIEFMDEAASQTKVQRRQEDLVARIDRNFYADEPIELPHAAKLPEVFFETVTIRSNGSTFGTVEQAALNLAMATGLGVRVAPDVKSPPPRRRSGGASAGSGGGASTGGSGATQGQGQAQAGAGGELSVVRLDYKGPAINYIKQIAESAGIDWEFRNDTVIFSRLISRTFALASINPGGFSVQDGINKSGANSTGQSSGGGGGSGSGGTFGTTSSIATQASYSLWSELKATLTGCLTEAGSLSISEGVGSVTVTDTKDAVECTRQQIERENAELAKQVSVEVRSIKLRITDTNQAGIQLDPVYSVLRNGSAAASIGLLSSPSTRTTNGGQLAAVVSGTTSRWYGSTGFVQALKQLGTVVADGTSTVVTSNRVPAMTATYNTYGFLAETKAAQGGSDGSAGTPGLTPGSVTVGTFLRVLPTIRSNNTIMLNMSVDNSNLTGYGSARTGTGESEQQIQWANTDGNKITSNVALNHDESLVLAGIGEENLVTGNANGIGGTSTLGERKKFVYIVIVSPRILKGL